MTLRSNGYLVIVALMVLAAMSACGGGPERLRLGLQAEHDANENSPLAVAVLVVYNPDVMRELSKLTAREWFDQAVQRQRDNPDMSDFDLLSWELMPGQKIKETNVELQGKEAQGLVFADYFSEGTHRARFNPGRRVMVLLGNGDLKVVDLEGEE